MKPVSQSGGRVTIKDIADKLGISKATVSRALLERARVAEETRKQVLKVAKELGYRPDPTLRALSNLRWTQHPESRATYRVALLGIFPKPQPGVKAQLDEPNDAALQRAVELGIQLDMLPVNPSSNLMHFGNTLFHRGYDAILFSMRCPVEEWKFPFERFPCLAISFLHPAHRIHQVTSDWFSAATIAIEEVHARGYKRVGFTHYCRGNPSIDKRIWACMLAGRSRFETEFGSAPSIFKYEPEDKLGDAFYEGNRERFMRWFEQEKPDVVIDSGFLAYWWMKDAGLQMPDDVGVLGLRQLSTQSNEHISSIDHNLHQQGRWAVDTLYNLIQTGNRGFSSAPVRITVACELFEGRTLRPRGPGAR